MALHEGIGLAGFHALSEDRATHALYQCCSSCIWARRVAADRPYPSVEAVLQHADEVLADLGEAQVDDALDGHPRIGERTASAASSREQAGVSGAAPDVLAALADGNAAYEERFGHVYLVHASGRSADELLAVLRERLGNDATTERRVLREQLALINRARLTRLLEPVDWEALAWSE